MMRSMYAAISGLRTHQTMLDVTANDLANVNTVGYKGARTTFKDSLAQLQMGATAPGGGQGGSNPLQVGLGVQLGSVDNQMTTGALQSTGNPLDVAIQGDGFFRVALGTPPAAPAATAVQYTRAGSFTLNSQGYLVTQEGWFVLGTGGANPPYIQIPAGATNVSIGTDGTVTYVDTAGTLQTAGQLELAKFQNAAGLMRMSGNRWAQTLNSGTPQLGAPASAGFGATIAGTLEMSNVDLASEFTDMITAQRGFQANSRVISTSDEMLADLVNLKR